MRRRARTPNLLDTTGHHLTEIRVSQLSGPSGQAHFDRQELKEVVVAPF